MKARTFWKDRTSSGIGEYTFKKVELREPKKLADAKPGVIYDYFENTGKRWRELPNFDLLTPKRSGIVTKINIEKKQRDEKFGFVFKGLFRAQKDGIYTFYTISDDGSQFYIDSDMIVDNDAEHGMVEKKGQVALQAGLHPLKVTFFQGRGGLGLNVLYKGPGEMKQEMLSNVLFHE